jgi:uncharacterized protein YecE (DUF72 family)
MRKPASETTSNRASKDIGVTEKQRGSIRIGVGGWTYEPWRQTFYPAKLPRDGELRHAATTFTSIEVNGTYYRSQKPETFAKWRDETPDGFVFSLKAPRYATNRRVLAEAKESVERFFTGGVMELKDKLGAINWQFMPTKRFDPADFESFLRLLPKQIDGRAIRHAVEVRHESFRSADFVAMARDHEVAIVLAGDSEYPRIDDLTAGFVYARIMGTRESEPLGYPAPTLDLWARHAKNWASGTTPRGAKPLLPARDKRARDVYLYVISGHKAFNPAAASALMERVS